MTETTTETTGADLMKFWDFAASRHLMRRETADTMKSACKVVLSTVEPETWEAIDVTTIDIDAFLTRFQNAKRMELKPDSLRVYGQRLRNGISTFQDWLANPTSWSYPNAESRASNGEAKKKKVATPKPKVETASEVVATATVNTTGTETITYPYPIRPGLIISMTLPADLTKAEATRLATFVSSLAMEPQLALPAPRDDASESA